MKRVSPRFPFALTAYYLTRSTASGCLEQALIRGLIRKNIWISVFHNIYKCFVVIVNSDIRNAIFLKYTPTVNKRSPWKSGASETLIKSLININRINAVSNKSLFSSCFLPQIRVWSRKDAIDSTDLALSVAENVLNYYEKFFNIPYPLTKIGEMELFFCVIMVQRVKYCNGLH